MIMPAEFGRDFEALVRDADHASLADPAALHRIGARRRTRNRALAGVTGAVAVLALLATVATLVWHNPSAAPGGGPSATPSGAATSTLPLPFSERT
jgi:hypothetical protein